MGCGGSRADAIEPRYYESWTRETESTWLTNTDSESPAQDGGSAEPGAQRPGVLEDGKSAQTGVTAASAAAGTLNTEKRNNGGPQCANPMVHGAGATTQRQNGFRAAETLESPCVNRSIGGSIAKEQVHPGCTSPANGMASLCPQINMYLPLLPAEV